MPGLFGYLQRVFGNGASDKPKPLSTRPVGHSGGVTPEQKFIRTDPESRINLVANHGLLSQLFFAATDLAASRRMRYIEYDQMEENVIIASFLSLITEDAYQRDPDSEKSVWIDPDFQYAKELEDLFEKLDVENRGHGWMYNCAKFGDFFLKPSLATGLGVVAARDDLHPTDVWRIDVQGQLLAFAYTDRLFGSGNASAFNSVGGVAGDVRIVVPDQMIHFVFNYRPTFERFSLSIPANFYDELEDEDGDLVQSTESRSLVMEAQQRLIERKQNLRKRLVEALQQAAEVSGEMTMMGDPVDDHVSLAIQVSGRYGTSALYEVRKDYKILTLMEQALALGRLARSGVARIFSVNTVDATPEERARLLRELEDKLTKRQAFDATTQLYQSEYSPLNYLDDIFLPTTGGRGDVTVQQLGGDLNIKDAVDIDYFLSKVFSGLRVPKAYLGFEEMLPGSLGAATPLIQLDVRYARTVKKLQRAFMEGIKDLCSLHLKYKLGVNIPAKDIPLNMSTISGAEEMARMDIVKSRIETAQAIADFVTAHGGDGSKAARELFDDIVARALPSLNTDGIFDSPNPNPEAATADELNLPKPEDRTPTASSTPAEPSPPEVEPELTGTLTPEEEPTGGEGEV